MNMITDAKLVSPQEFEAMSLDGFNIIKAIQEDGPIAGNNVYRTIELWSDLSAAKMQSPGHSGEGDSIRVLDINVPDITDKEAIDRLRQKISAKLAQNQG